MRWDDLQLLRLADELEQTEPSALGNGLGLMQRAAGTQGFPAENDQRSFARELLIARDAGYMGWEDDRLAAGVPTAYPLLRPGSWLQEIRDLRLTLAGRDRARGRVVLRQLPDPDEDDDRPITGMTLEEISRAIGDTYSASQLPRYLRDLGVPEDFIPPEAEGSKWEYVLTVLEHLHDGGSAARRALREFIGGWLEGTHHDTPRSDIRRRIIALLGRQGWHVREGRLVIGEKTFDAAGVLTPLGQDARIAALPRRRTASGAQLP